MFKQIMIPVAAFAVTAAGASAFGGGMIENLDILSDSETAAFEEVREIREAANEEAKAVLEAAGIDEERMGEIREATHEARAEHREALENAIEAADYEAFLAVAEDTSLGEVITSESDFEQLLEAHELRESGDHEGAAEIMDALGLERLGKGAGGQGGMRGGHGMGGPGSFGDRQSAEAG